MAWKSWCEGGSAIHARFLWIHGLPGAGKTVLASFAVDDVTSKYQHKGVSYYYCSHERHKRGHTSSEEACSFLRWVIRDLTAQVTRPMTRVSNRQASIPKILENLYVEHDFTIPKLLDCLLAVTEYIAIEFKQQVCIVIDAVDESPSPRDVLLNVLTTIGTNPDWQHVSLCFTSRNEQDIARAVDAIQPSQPSRSSRSPTPESPSRRVILTPVAPSARLSARGTGSPRVSSGGFDGRPPYSDDMPPPPLPHGGNARGRPPVGNFSRPQNPLQRVSRSESRGRPSGGRDRSLSTHSALESRVDDPMEIDSPGHISPRVVSEGCTILSMDDNPDVREAIRTFVRAQLQDKDTFYKDPLEEVINLVAKRARGM